ncbi:MAG TPA: hypothetical protein VMF55_00070 [Solirubrobacterales bacterium]|nr:hypothetical protein [Solirubrobacterales bacterium]
MTRSALTALAVLATALLLGGCGGGSSSSTPAGGGSEGGASQGGAGAGGAGEGGAPAGGAPKKATAPNAPAGSKVVACGGGAKLRATELSCAAARATMARWEATRSCALGKGDSRGSCTLGRLRCQATAVDGGTAVGCAGPEGDVAFLVRSAG